MPLARRDRPAVATRGRDGTPMIDGRKELATAAWEEW